ncbi:replication protein P [Cronobacter dublinensis]|uniref:replication protein P n=1 Tax=Cronobacter dublinensis TaxID=413497 RepID=UPI003518F3F3
MSKQLIQAIAHRDSQTLSRVANKYQPTQEHAAKGVVNTEAERLVDALFRQLKQVFPASAATNLRTDADEAAAKQQWILAFAENGITKREQLAAGMKRARASLSPYWPSPGQFIEWCREGEVIQAGLPTVDELVKLIQAYSARRGYYETAEAYPWKHPTHYWMVTFLYSKMRACYWTESELHYYASEEIKKMFVRIKSGEEIPPPCTSLPQKNKGALSKADSLKKIKELRLKHGFLNCKNSKN